MLHWSKKGLAGFVAFAAVVQHLPGGCWCQLLCTLSSPPLDPVVCRLVSKRPEIHNDHDPSKHPHAKKQADAKMHGHHHAKPDQARAAPPDEERVSGLDRKS